MINPNSLFAVGFEGIYTVSETGVVTSAKTGRELFLNTGKLGYVAVVMYNNGVRHTLLLHRVVAMAFIPNPENKPQVNHKDGNKSNNHVSNLEWCTQSENRVHANKMGLCVIPSGENDYRSKAILQMDLDNNIIAEWGSINKAAKTLKIHSSRISKAVNGTANKNNKLNGYIWKFK